MVGACPGQAVGDQVPPPLWASVCVPVGVGTGCNGIWRRPVPWEQGGLAPGAGGGCSRMQYPAAPGVEKAAAATHAAVWAWPLPD